MAINWSSVGSDILNAITGVLGPAWQTNYPSALAQVQAIIAAGQQLDQSLSGPNPMPQSDYNTLKTMQQRALEGVLLAYEGIGLIVAQQAAAAAWNALTKAIATAYPIVGLVL